MIYCRGRIGWDSGAVVCADSSIGGIAASADERELGWRGHCYARWY